MTITQHITNAYVVDTSRDLWRDCLCCRTAGGGCFCRRRRCVSRRVTALIVPTVFRGNKYPHFEQLSGVLLICLHDGQDLCVIYLDLDSVVKCSLFAIYHMTFVKSIIG